MVRVHLIRLLVALAVGVAVGPATATAQSTIAGQVRDDTGGVLPGVSVEASSPELIEGSRTVVTDARGQYVLVEVRPGPYTITFSLPGFGTVVRRDVEVRASVVTSIDMVMKVGGVAETVTVSGATPLVDVRSAQRTQVLDREVLDNVPTAKSLWSAGNLVAGVIMQAPDVGGSSNVQDRPLAAHGASSAHTSFTNDSINVNTLIGDGSEPNYFTEFANQEVSIQTSGGNADSSAGGLRVNMIPRDGGNTFSGTAYSGGVPGKWQGNNFTQRLKDAGIHAVDKIDRIWDTGISAGGPIIKGRIWYNMTFRYFGNYTFQSDTFRDNGDQNRLESHVWSTVPRLTIQVTPKNKLSFLMDRQARFRGPHLQATYPAVVNGLGNDPETATSFKDAGRPYYHWQGKWTSTVSSRLLLDASFAYVAQLFEGRPQDGVDAERGSPEWYSHVRKTDPDLQQTWNGQANTWSWPVRKTSSFSMSYVTGSHNTKVGLQHTWGYYHRTAAINGDITTLTYRNGVPNSVSVGNYPIATTERVNYDSAIFAQDSWTINRLTLNGGLRYEFINASVDEGRSGPGRFVGDRHFDEVKNVPNWRDLSPRFAAAYDLFGNGSTALKFSVGRYLRPTAQSLAQALNPLDLVSVAIPWNDRDLSGRALSSNLDGIAQDNEIDRSRLPANFGERTLDKLDPDIKREANRETTLGVQRRIGPRVSVAATWYRRTFQNLRFTDNLERDFGDWVGRDVVSPLNGEVITVYDLRNAAEVALINNVIRSSSERQQIYNGFDVVTEARLPQGGVVFGSVTTQRMIHVECDQPDDPNLVRFCDRSSLPSQYTGVPFITDFKVAGSYPIPLGIRASFSYISAKDKGTFLNGGRGLPTNWLLSRTTQYSAPGCVNRPCTPGAFVFPTLVQTSLTVPLEPSGTNRFLPRLNELSLGIKKSFRAGKYTYEASFDVFNALNVDTWTAERSANYDTPTFALPGNSAGFTAPPGIIVGRIPRIGLQVKW